MPTNVPDWAAVRTTCKTNLDADPTIHTTYACTVHDGAPRALGVVEEHLPAIVIDYLDSPDSWEYIDQIAHNTQRLMFQTYCEWDKDTDPTSLTTEATLWAIHNRLKQMLVHNQNLWTNGIKARVIESYVAGMAVKLTEGSGVTMLLAWIVVEAEGKAGGYIA